jgi:hypothetical protein
MKIADFYIKIVSLFFSFWWEFLFVIGGLEALKFI